MSKRSSHRLALGLAASLMIISACAPEDGSTGTTEEKKPATSSCAVKDLKTHKPGKLTIATDQPGYEPWIVDDDPESGKGFESAVAYAVADRMGFEKNQVVWTRVKFNNAIQPGPKDFDFDINQFSIDEKRKRAVDFSSGYYDVQQAIIALKSNKAAKAKSLADLKNANLGAQVNTTSGEVISKLIRPSTEIQSFPTNTNAKQALQNGTVDALVVDLPTAFFMTGAEIKGATIVGQVDWNAGEPEQFGLLLDKGSPLTKCTTKAVDSLRKDRTLEKLADRWLSQAADVPVLQ